MTPSEIRTRASRGCRALRTQYDLSTKEGFRRSRAREPTYSNELKMVSRCTDGRRISYVRFYGAPDLTTPVWVWCNCPYFLYYLEVALTRVGSSSIRNSNGKPPTVRNPHMHAYLCKHLVLAADVAVAQKRDLILEELEGMEETPA